MNLKRKRFIDGVCAVLPFSIGVIPFMIAYSIIATSKGLSMQEAFFMDVVVFAGSSQLVAIEMLSKGVTPIVAIFSAVCVNLRHLLMGVSLTQYLKDVKTPHLAMLAYGLTDETYAVSYNEFSNNIGKKYNHYFLLGASANLYFVCNLFVIVGCLIGNYIENPLAWGLDFAMPGMFLCIIIPQIKNIKFLLVTIVSAVVTIVCYLYVPGNWYVIIAAITATLVGMMLDNIKALDEKEKAEC